MNHWLTLICYRVWAWTSQQSPAWFGRANRAQITPEWGHVALIRLWIKITGKQDTTGYQVGLSNVGSEPGPPKNSTNIVSRLNLASWPQEPQPHIAFQNNTLEKHRTLTQELAKNYELNKCVDNSPRSLSNVPPPFPMLDSKSQRSCRRVLLSERVQIFSPLWLAC